MRHSVNIVVAMLSMAAGAWQGTTAQTEQPGSTTQPVARQESPAQLTLRGCVQKGLAPGTFVLTTPIAAPDSALDAASTPAARAQNGGLPADEAAAAAPAARNASYELVAGTPGIDLTSLVGRRVQAQGTTERTARGASADDDPAAAAASADSPSADTPAGTSGRLPQRSRLRVTMIRALGGACD